MEDGLFAAGRRQDLSGRIERGGEPALGVAGHRLAQRRRAGHRGILADLGHRLAQGGRNEGRGRLDRVTGTEVEDPLAGLGHGSFTGLELGHRVGFEGGEDGIHARLQGGVEGGSTQAAGAVEEAVASRDHTTPAIRIAAPSSCTGVMTSWNNGQAMAAATRG